MSGGNELRSEDLKDLPTAVGRIWVSGGNELRSEDLNDLPTAVGRIWVVSGGDGLRSEELNHRPTAIPTVRQKNCDCSVDLLLRGRRLLKPFILDLHIQPILRNTL